MGTEGGECTHGVETRWGGGLHMFGDLEEGVGGGGARDRHLGGRSGKYLPESSSLVIGR